MRSEKQTVGKRIIYRYNGDPKDDETITDSTGAMGFHRVGDILKRRNKSWKVVVARREWTGELARIGLRGSGVARG